MATKYAPMVLLWQKHGPLEWQHLPVSGSRTLIPFHTLISSFIAKGYLHAWQLFGLDPDIIVVPFTKTQLSWLF
jgi:hypothetical protein